MTAHSLFVTSAHEGWSLEDFLIEQLPEYSKADLRRRLIAGEVRINGSAGWLGRRLRSGERVSLDRIVSDDKRSPLQVLTEEKGFLVLSKDPGVPVVPERQPVRASVLDLLRARGDAEVYYPVHRLDRDTSGVLIVAKSREAHRNLSLQFQNREVEKTYLALVTGETDEAEGCIELPIGYDPRHALRMTTDRNEGKMSRTRYRVRERFRDYTWVEVHPETGRTHQIRVHLAGIGHALAVDPTYGSRDHLYLSDIKPGYRPKRKGPEHPMIDRLSLHAEKIGFRHPETGEPRLVEADLPDDLVLTLKMLRKYRPLARSEDE